MKIIKNERKRLKKEELLGKIEV
jgi:hypothetical protein